MRCRSPPSGFESENSKPEGRTMRNYKDSDYALNRYSKGIVYKFADGIVEITLEDYLRDNPDKTEEDFAELKAMSDEIYYQQDRQEYRVSHRDVSSSGMEDTLVASASSVDAELIQKAEEKKALEAAIRLLESGKLTDVQKRSFYLHFFQGLSTRQIEKLEGINQKTAWESLMWAEKKLKKIYNG
jgi:DNA-directed RNA polymerase specialized sigma24 family protein